MLGFFKSKVFKIYIVPGMVFQSVMIGGGYGTGREVVEYFTSYGPVGGLLGLSVSFALLGLILALTFEFARVFKAFDYRNFFKRLLGPGWVVFELLIILQFLLVLAVLASASGNIIRDNFGIPYEAGIALMLVVIGILTFFGRDVIVKALSFWSFFLYAVFLAFFISTFSHGLEPVVNAFSQAEIEKGWLGSGFKYTLYNVSAAPLLLYITRDFETRRQAMGSGVIASAIAIVPAVIFQIAFLAAYPEVLDEAIPVYWMMSQFGMATLLVVYSVMLFGTFIETGAGMLQGVNDRIDAYLIEKRGKGLGRSMHAALAIVAIVISALLSLWGITNLIAKGYGTMAWGFLAVYVIPLLTIGALQILKANRK